jgi:uncharacterized protein (TIGR04255 family)
MYQEGLRPIKNRHSIREAVISVFLQSPIPSPLRFKNLLSNEIPEFQKFDPVNLFTLELRHEPGQKSSKYAESPDIGFRLTKLSSGDPEFIIQGINEGQRQFFSFHFLNYSSWSDFIELTKKYLSLLSKFQPGLQMIAFSLHYVDEFDWELEKLSPSKIFNNTSNLLPQHFIDSNNSKFSFLIEKIRNGDTYIDRLDLEVSSNTEKVILSNNLIKELPNGTLPDELFSDNIFSLLEFFHVQNKENLRQILSNDVLSLIGLLNA